MKTKLFFLMAMLLSFTIAIAADNKATEVFTLDHQMSEHCEKKIKENLRFEKGVSDIVVSLKENTITIKYNPKKTDTEKLIKAFKKIGFNASVVDPENCNIQPAPCGHCSSSQDTGTSHCE